MADESASSPETGEELPGQAEYEALAAFRYALRSFTAFSEASAHQAGLTPQQHQTLLTIKGSRGGGPLSVGEIAERMHTRAHSAVELITRLERLGMVARANDPADRRRVLVSLTPAAEQILRDLSAVHLRELRAIRPVLLELLARFGEG